MTDPFRYEAKRVVVTGGASGVGAALVDLLAELGAEHVTVLDLNKPSTKVDQFIQTNLAVEVETAIKAIKGPVHALFNNAGVAATLPAPVVMAVNYLALRRLSEGLLDRI